MDENTRRRFLPQPVIGNMPERIETLREWIIAVADYIEQACPDSRERALALTHLEEALMWGNKSIVLGDATIQP